MSLGEHVRAVARLSADGKRDYLQKLLGPHTDDPGELQFRALLVTALNTAKVWPHVREDATA